jgi:hypothetical protein
VFSGFVKVLEIPCPALSDNAEVLLRTHCSLQMHVGMPLEAAQFAGAIVREGHDPLGIAHSGSRASVLTARRVVADP